MRGVMMAGKGGSTRGFVVGERAVPEIGEGEILVKMEACGLCGTDLEKMRGEYTAAMPVLGHEAVGTVAEVGPGVEGFREGDRVFPHHHVPCYECYLCKAGETTLCANYKTSNLDPGGFVEEFRVPSWNLSKGGVLRLAEGLDFDTASLVEPVACCQRAITRAAVKEGDCVLVVGAGPVGMMHTILTSGLGARVFVSDVLESRLQFAEKSGWATALDAKGKDPSESVKEATGGRGADLAIVAAGSPKAVLQGVAAVRKGGKVCVFGVPQEGAEFGLDLPRLYSSGTTLFPSYGADEADVARAASEIASRAGEYRSLITHKYGISEFGRGVDAATSGEAMKVVIVP
jgi:L-iditol 2-dehydrogenase